jgi:hypothetical protein
MDEVNPKQQTTSILELLYLIRAKNRGDISFAEFRESASQWAEAVIAEYEAGQADARTVNENERCG